MTFGTILMMNIRGYLIFGSFLSNLSDFTFSKYKYYIFML